MNNRRKSDNYKFIKKGNGGLIINVRKSKTGKVIGAVLAFVLTVLPATTAAFALTPKSYNNKASITVGKTITATESGVFPAINEFQFLLDPVSYTPGPTNPDSIKYTSANLPMPGGKTGQQAINVDGFLTNAPGTSQKKTATSDPITYTQTGVYTYKLTENIPATPVAGVTYDDTVYYVDVYVTNVLNDDGTPLLDKDGKPVVNVSAITAWKGTNTSKLDPMGADNGGAAPDPNAADGKIGITVPTGTDDGVRNIAYPFVNNYSTASLYVTKLVTGDMADPNQEFSFTLGLSSAAGKADSANYAYEVYNMGNDQAVGGGDDTLASNGSITDSGNFQIKHNQYIKVIGLPTGEKVTTTEAGTADYKTTISVDHGNTVTPGTLTTVATKVTANKTTGEQTIFSGDGAVNQENFVNDKQSIPPTGVVMTILPYALLVALVGFGAVIIFKKRRVNE